MRQVCAAVLMLAIVAPTGAALAGPASHQQLKTCCVQGIARDAHQRPLAGARIQVRRANGQLAATATTDADGSFCVPGLEPGDYTFEVLDEIGALVGVTPTTTITECAATIVTVTASAAGALARATGGGLNLFGFGSLGTLAVIGAAAAIGTSAVVTARNGKFVVCHRPEGGGAHTIEVGASAMDPHLAHGDTAGACPASPSK